MKSSETGTLPLIFKPFRDLAVTLVLWSYYTVGFIVIFSPFYLMALIFSKNRERSFQHLNHYFYRGFFGLVRVLIPGVKWRIDEDIRAVRSSVVVCNHVSYLDSILMISLFERQRTIVKSRFFRIPIFRQVIEISGYIPSRSEGKLSDLVIRRVEEMDDYLTSGGNLFIFPEGTRSRDGAIGKLNPGAFKIARLCRKPVVVLFARNTDKLFQPGKFLFNTCSADTITVKKIGCLKPDYHDEKFSVSGLIRQVRSLLEAEQARLAL